MRHQRSILLACLFLTACAPFKPTDHRAAYCNELNSQIIFSGGTYSDRHSEIQSAQEPLMQKNYDADCVK